MAKSEKTGILILDPQRSVRNSLKERLEFEGYEVYVTDSLEDAYEAHDKTPFDVLLCDGEFADQHVNSEKSGYFQKLSPIVLSRSPSIETAVHAIRAGAFDFVPKPIDMNQLLGAIRNAAALAGEDMVFSQNAATGDSAAPTRKENNALQDKGAFELNRNCNCPQGSNIETIIGDSSPINHVKELIDKVGPLGARVLITGPNGAGKELVAHWLHEKSPRCGMPFVEVNCAAIPSELIESELFGHEKGAFTSAVKQRKGKFEQADNGTLFLDEIGDMSLAAQAKVLRALQDHKISRVGGDKDIEVDVRIISATNKNLKEEIKLGNFREDLYHRLSVIIIHVPPLNDRLDDIPLLVNFFIRKICSEYGISTKQIDKPAIAELKKMDWTGNIRELRNVVERLIILSGEKITVDDVKTYAVAVG